MAQVTPAEFAIPPEESNAFVPIKGVRNCHLQTMPPRLGVAA